MKKFISIALIVLGVLIILTPFIRDMIVENFSKSIDLEEISLEDIRDNNEKLGQSDLEEDFNFSNVDDVGLEESIRGAMNFDPSKIKGLLYVPSLKMKLPIMEGLSDASLMAGAGTMKKDQVMGQGNYSLAGHHMKNKSLLFGSLMEIEEGATVYLSDGENIYEYRVEKIEVVEDTRVDMVEDKMAEDGPIVSLMTCYHTSKTGKRFFAIGSLVDVFPANENKELLN